MTNDVLGAFIAGIAFMAFMLGIFQFGINIGLRTCIRMLDGNYPAAMRFLVKNKTTVNVLPYIMEASE